MTGSNPLAQPQLSAGRVEADMAGIAQACDILRGGGVVAVPTETVYGLAADASNAHAVAAIYRTKGRPDFNPLIVHVTNHHAAGQLAEFNTLANSLAAAFWPGPMTLVLPRKSDATIVGAVTAGLPTIAIRVPAHPVMQQLLRQSGLCLAAPSANISGGISPTRAAHVMASLGDGAPFILDAGPCAAGLESTIVAVRDDNWQILRPGPVTSAEIAMVAGKPPMPLSSNAIEAPGQLASHYAPSKPLRLNAMITEADEWFVGFGAVTGDDNLSIRGDLAEAAVHLFDALHRADASKKVRIAVAPVPTQGIGIAINDRLSRAAAR